MPLQPWAALVTREVRDRIPDVRASRAGTAVTWTFGTETATLDARDIAQSYLRFGKAMTIDERRNAESARVAAANIVIHFDSRWCRGFDVAPYSESEMWPFEGEARPLGSTFGAKTGEAPNPSARGFCTG